MRVLDLGCGTGSPPLRANLSPDDEVIGIDVNEQSPVIARQRFPGRMFVQARGEQLPFRDGHFERLVSAIALPYMNIPRTLAQVHRVLAKGGTVFSLHSANYGEPFRDRSQRSIAARFWRAELLSIHWAQLGGVISDRAWHENRPYLQRVFLDRLSETKWETAG